MTVQTGLCRTWSETQSVGFLMRWLICHYFNDRRGYAISCSLGLRYVLPVSVPDCQFSFFPPRFSEYEFHSDCPISWSLLFPFYVYQRGPVYIFRDYRFPLLRFVCTTYVVIIAKFSSSDARKRHAITCVSTV